MEPNKISNEYLHRLQAVYHEISKRGILVSPERIAKAQKIVAEDIEKQLAIVSKSWGCRCYLGGANANKADKTEVNLNASSGSRTPLARLKELGYTIPKIGVRDEDGNYVSKESLAELTLQKMYAANQFGVSGGEPSLRALLRIRELSTIDSRYLRANFYNRNGQLLFLSNYNVAGTVTGRRASRKHIFGYGNNAQNFPKHGVLASLFRSCLIARPGKIFLSVDQMQAEDWPVSALANNTEALKDLEHGVDRHTKLASMIFNIPIESRTEKEWKDSIERYLGKKTRHANNYGMRANTMSDTLAKEGHAVSAEACKQILTRVNQIDPSVDSVFHEYVRQCLYKDRTLTTPFGRSRIFLGLRAGDAGGNNKIFNEAYSYIPQSTVGDNTALALYELETKYPDSFITHECHDSIMEEIDDSLDTIWEHVQRIRDSFKRTITFHNGLSVDIPVEAELSFNFNDSTGIKSKLKGTKKLDDVTYQDVSDSYHRLKEEAEKKEQEGSINAKAAE